MRANQILLTLVVAIFSLTATSSFASNHQKQEKHQASNSKKAADQKAKQKAKREAKAKAKAAKLKAAAERKAARLAARLARIEAEKARRAAPRSAFKMTMKESLNHGLVVASIYRIKNVQTSESGVASAELEVRDAFDQVIRTESCAATAELPTEIKADDYRLKCKINNKQVFVARLQILDVAPGIYSGTAQNTTDIEGVDTYPVGYGAVSLMAAVPPSLPPVDCVLSEFTPFSACVGNVQSRTRTILVAPENGGQACGPTEEVRFCF